MLRDNFVLIVLFLGAATLPLPAQNVKTGQGASSSNHLLSPDVRAVLSSIAATQLRGDLSFLASDALQGRFTPSPGLDVAAEFIAAQFREAGLEPGGDQDYFQTTAMIDRHLPKLESGMTVQMKGQPFEIPAGSVSIFDANQAAKISGAPVLVYSERNLDALKKAEIGGKAILVRDLDFRSMPQEQAMAQYRKTRAFDRFVSTSSAAVEIVVTKDNPDAARPKLLFEADAQKRSVPVIRIASEQLEEWLNHPGAAEGAQVSVEIPAPDDRRVILKNVVGILRGSDPKLKSTCVLLTAHYDHIGTVETGAPMATSAPPKDSQDRIYNGANDDGSGTVSVIEIARALAKLNPRPKRSLVFMTFFGEERGEFGSRFYGQHPIFPITQTVADVNLEQVGRTDSTNGKQVNTASLTGYDYSDVTKYLKAAGRETGIKVYKDPEASDAYFTRSDNDALAEQGVPAHSLTVAFDYPDYHALGDEWQKIDYENMARVDRMVALSLVNIANSSKAPEWNAQNSKTAPFREAQRKAFSQ